MNHKAYRQVLGERLKAFREELGVSQYKISQLGNIRPDQVKIVEDGNTNYTIDTFLGYIHGCDLYMYFATNYTIDTFLGYIHGCDLYMYFATKDDVGQSRGLGDLIDKGVENYPG